MAQQIIDLTSNTVNSILQSFNKINENFIEVFAACGPLGTGSYANSIANNPQLINIGAGGDTILAAFTKMIANFNTLYSVLPSVNYQTINLGANANSGDSISTAFGKTNNNFTDIYSTLGITGPSPTLISYSPTVYSFAGNTEYITVDTNSSYTYINTYPPGLQLIDLGTGPDTQTGDSVYVAFGKVNHDLAELYTVFGNGSADLHGNVIYANSIEALGNIYTGQNFITPGNIIGSHFLYPNGVSVTSQVVSSSYSNANVASYLPVYSGNLDSVNNITMRGNLSVGGSITYQNIETGNLFVDNAITANGNVTANYFIGNGSQLTGIVTYTNVNVASYLASNSNVTITTTENITGNYFIGRGTTLTNITGANVVGNVTSAISATYVTGLTGANVNIALGYVPLNSNATVLTAQYVTGNTQPNITSVGNLSSLTVTGNINAGNLFGNLSQLYNNGYTATLQDSGQLSAYYIQASGGYFTSPYGIAFTYAGDTNQQFSWTIVNADALALQSTISSTLDTTLLTVNRTTGNLSLVGNINTPSNITATYFFGNGSQLTGLGNSAYSNSAGSAGTVTSNAQPNITSVGTLTSLTSSGNITGTNGSFTTMTVTGNISANVGTLTTLTSSGNIIGTSGSFTTMTVTGNISANNYLGNAIPLSIPTDGNITDGAITRWSTMTSLADAIDDLNAALDNVRANTFVKSTTFTGSPLSGGAGTNVVLTVTSVGNPNLYSVNWGDGNITSGASASPSHVYSNNVLSPFTVTVTSSNSNGSGTGSSANFTRTNYIIIYTADPVMGFNLFRTNTGGSALSGTAYQTGLYVNEGDTFYLQNTTTNTTMANVTYSINYGDGVTSSNVASDSANGGVLGNRYPYAYGYTASSGTGTNTVNLTILTHTTANPASIPRSTTVGLKVYDVNIAAPSGLSSKTIAFTGNVGTTPYLAASFANNTGSSSTITAGSAVARTIATSGTIDTANLTSYSYNANAGILSAYVNGVQRGNVTFANADQSGTYGNLVVTSESDYWLLTSAGVGTSFALSTYSPNLYTGFTAQVKSTASTTLTGLNNFKLVHSTTGNTNIVEFVKDNVTTVPTVDVGNASVYQGTAGTFRYVSGIPYYNTGSPTVIVSNVRINSWIGQTYSGPVSTVNPITVEAGTNQESTTGNVIVTQAKGYSTIDGNVTYLSSNIPIANTGATTGYAIGNMTVNVAGVASVQAVQTIKFIANNVNGSSSYSATTANIQVFTATPSGFVEDSITCTVTDNAGANSQVAKRIVITSAAGATPTYVTTRNYYSSNAWTGSQTIAGTDEAVTRFGNLKPFTTDLSTGYLPIGPNLAITGGRTSTQYFRGAWARTGRNSWNVTITGKISGLYFAVPGTSIDTLPFTANGWLDANVAYFGSGVAGALSSGCAASTPVPYGQTISGTTYGITLGTGSTSASGSTGNQVLVSIALGPTDYVTSWSFS